MKNNTKQTSCDIFGRVVGTPQARAQYLVDHNSEFCDINLRSCVEENHRFRFKKDFIEAVNLYAQENPNDINRYYSVTWDELEREISFYESGIAYHCYSKYLSFEVSSDDKFKHIFIDRFNEEVSCYSIQLLRGIADKYNLEPFDTFTFVKARVRSSQYLEEYRDIFAFTVKGNYYDISDDPSKGIRGSIEPSPI